ncbi:MAG: RNA-binding protein [Verrucomicrobiota bacterium]
MSNSKLYVGNMAYSITENDIEEAFSQYGTVEEIKMVHDRDTGKFRGFAFVQLNDPAAAKAAIEALDGQDFQGRKLVVNEARPQENRGGGGGGRQFRGGGGGHHRGGGGGRKPRY